ncbi:F0F1 ATP synthase subunit delta [Alloprevotella sp. OH1205_COT-284]|uniref:F0F1 ATP synthase subunit delta n=1 Tax=Alloprevotella sp. OH1205_COT-284 TaxID=2491043 RepID=UPI000F5E871E|nr:F0F1 ATP synthase subunit delta [Alloprevotella sp. OH1205_COT-284]RRD80421.1 F0F1 ATP synthase subunit delta [Alloprevotella sp. OH1205_COT-284]
MDIGIVASRYAKALFRFSVEKNEEKTVYSEMQRLDRSFRQVAALNVTLQNPLLKNEQKISLLSMACAEEKQEIAESTKRFIRLVVEKKRAEMMHFIATSFVRLYEEEKRIVNAHLTLATPATERVTERLLSLVKARTNREVCLNTNVDPTLQAGFILEYDDYRLDASLRGQLENLRRDLK